MYVHLVAMFLDQKSMFHMAEERQQRTNTVLASWLALLAPY
jgi:hypothetical protein